MSPQRHKDTKTGRVKVKVDMAARLPERGFTQQPRSRKDAKERENVILTFLLSFSFRLCAFAPLREVLLSLPLPSRRNLCVARVFVPLW